MPLARWIRLRSHTSCMGPNDVMGEGLGFYAMGGNLGGRTTL
jgi:hypothetical protein